MVVMIRNYDSVLGHWYWGTAAQNFLSFTFSTIVFSKLQGLILSQWHSGIFMSLTVYWIIWNVKMGGGANALVKPWALEQHFASQSSNQALVKLIFISAVRVNKEPKYQSNLNILYKHIK